MFPGLPDPSYRPSSQGLEAANHIHSQAQRAMHACMPALSSGYHAQKMEPHTVGQFFPRQFTSSR